MYIKTDDVGGVIDNGHHDMKVSIDGLHRGEMITSNKSSDIVT